MLDFVAATHGLVVDDMRPKDVYQLLEAAIIRDIAKFDCESTVEYLVGKVEAIAGRPSAAVGDRSPVRSLCT